MNILHIAAHLGDGAGKAISGLAIADKSNVHRILLLDEPRKFNHISNCCTNGVRVIVGGDAGMEIAEADAVVLNWWGNPLMNEFVADFPQVPCRVVLWMHKNGFYDPPLPQFYIDIADSVMVTSPLSLKNECLKNATLVFGFGTFDPQLFPHKTDYALTSEAFIIGYVGFPTYKKLPKNFADYCVAVTKRIPNARFVLVGETDSEIQRDIASNGLSERFDICGWRGNVLEMLLRFDVFGYLLRPDTFATTENAILEAMAVGLPVVMLREPLGEYFVEQGENGFIANNPMEYAEIMLRLSHDACLRERIGKAGRERCVAECSVRKNIAEFNKTMEAVKINKKQSRHPNYRKED
jgi:glycosyltransferase involved in cell wall biosynthesis